MVKKDDKKTLTAVGVIGALALGAAVVVPVVAGGGGFGSSGGGGGPLGGFADPIDYGPSGPGDGGGFSFDDWLDLLNTLGPTPAPEDQSILDGPSPLTENPPTPQTPAVIPTAGIGKGFGGGSGGLRGDAGYWAKLMPYLGLAPLAAVNPAVGIPVLIGSRVGHGLGAAAAERARSFISRNPRAASSTEAPATTQKTAPTSAVNSGSRSGQARVVDARTPEGQAAMAQASVIRAQTNQFGQGTGKAIIRW